MQTKNVEEKLHTMGTETHAFMFVMLETHVHVVMVFPGRYVTSTAHMVTVVFTKIK